MIIQVEFKNLKFSFKKKTFIFQVEFKNFTEPHDSYRAIAPLRLLKVKSSQKLPGKFLELSVVLTFSNI